MKIELLMPGEMRQHAIGFPEGYLITVERDDGMATSELEAWTAMTMLCAKIIPKKTKKKKEVSA